MYEDHNTQECDNVKDTTSKTLHLLTTGVAGLRMHLQQVRYCKIKGYLIKRLKTWKWMSITCHRRSITVQSQENHFSTESRPYMALKFQDMAHYMTCDEAKQEDHYMALNEIQLQEEEEGHYMGLQKHSCIRLQRQ